jgi:hypothetical protein
MRWPGTIEHAETRLANAIQNIVKYARMRGSEKHIIWSSVPVLGWGAAFQAARHHVIDCRQ